MNSPTNQQILSISELTGKIKHYLEQEYRFVRIAGEISNLKTPFSGHSYFTLKDDNAQLQAVLFKQRKRFINASLKNGQKVICFGQITVYEPRGSYQLVVDSIEPVGAGKIQLEFERIKKKLAAQGYFTEEKKLPVPKYPKKIAVISSPTGAAFADFLKIVRLRQAGIHIQLYPVRVQGENAPEEIASAINELNLANDHDVIVLIRGGGSLEDLQAFNDERVADAIFSASIPVVTGIGHQIDFTIADFCADYRSPTPTAAAEYLASDNSTLQRQLNSLRLRFVSRMQYQLTNAEQRLRYHSRSLKEITRQITDTEHKLKFLKNKMCTAIVNQITTTNSHLKHQAYRLQLHAPQEKIALEKSRLTSLQQRFQQAILQQLDTNKAKLGKNSALLHGVSPLATLARGYSVTRKKEERRGNFQIIRNAREISPGEQVEILLHQGRLECVVEKSYINNSNPEKK